MKKLLFILVAMLSLCACSSSDDENVSNAFSFNGKEYQISKASISARGLHLSSNDYKLEVWNCDFEIGKKNYLSAFDNALAFLSKANGEYQNYVYMWNVGKIKDDSYVTIKKNEDDNRTYVEVYVDDGTKVVKAKYYGTIN